MIMMVNYPEIYVHDVINQSVKIRSVQLIRYRHVQSQNWSIVSHLANNTPPIMALDAVSLSFPDIIVVKFVEEIRKVRSVRHLLRIRENS